MIEELLISNIRLFEGPEEWRIPLSPLTVFCGTNSAGKSTILKTLLLLCQTQSDADAPSRSGRIRLTGGLVDLGSYKSLVSHNQIDQNIMFGITKRGSMEVRHLQALLRIRNSGIPSVEPPSLTTELEYRLSARFICGTRASGPSELTRATPPNVPRHDGGPQQVFLKEASFYFRTENDLDLSWKVVADDESDLYHILMPLDYFGASSRGFQFMEITREPNATHARVEVLLRGLLPIGLWAQSKARKRKISETGEDWGFFPLPPLLSECTRSCCITQDKPLK